MTAIDDDHARLSDVLAAANTIPAMLAYWDASGRNRFANDAYVTWFGIAPANLRGMHIRELLGEALYLSNLPFIRGALAGEEQLFERTLVDAAGRVRYTQAQYIPVRTREGAPDGFAALITDITARVRTEVDLHTVRSQAAVLNDRARIADDLHDLVIQRLYAMGMSLLVDDSVADDELRARASRAVDMIDDSIRALRETISDLNRTTASVDVIAAVDEVLGEYSVPLGFRPALTFRDPPELIPSEVTSDLVAVLREALSNVARHAAATGVHVTITTLSGEIRMVVADDGCGIGTTRRSGLDNFDRRARTHGGRCDVHPNDPSGTVVDWHVPRDRA